MAIIKYSKEDNKKICQQIRDEIPIADYVISRGFQLTKKGKYYKIVGKKGHHDFSSIMINPDTNRFKYYAQDTKTRTIIDLVMLFDSCDTATAIEALKPLLKDRDFSRVVKPVKIKPYIKNTKLTELPKRADTMKNVYAYLTSTRKISSDVVDYFIYNEMLYQDTHKNCVFVRYDKQGNPTYCCKRGTNTYLKESFMWEDPDNDLEHCFLLDNGADTLIINESVIDAMSIMTILLALNNSFSKVNYVALGGACKYEAIDTILKENPAIKTVICALDSDDCGFYATNIIHEIVSSFPGIRCIDFYPYTENDWNDQLKVILKSNMSIAEYIKTHQEKLGGVS